MLSATQLWTFVPAAVLVAAAPGANNLLALRNGIRSGMRPAAIALLGRLSAFAIMLALVIAGLAVVLNRSQLVFEVLKMGWRWIPDRARRANLVAHPPAQVGPGPPQRGNRAQRGGR